MYDRLSVNYPISSLRTSAEDKDATYDNTTILLAPAEVNLPYRKRRASSSWDDGERQATRQRQSLTPCLLEPSRSGASPRSTRNAHKIDPPHLTTSVEAPAYEPSSPTLTCSSGTTLAGTPYPEERSLKVPYISPPPRLVPAIWDEQPLSDATSKSEVPLSRVPQKVQKPASSVPSRGPTPTIKTIRIAAECTLSDKQLIELGPGLSQAILQARKDYEEKKKQLQDPVQEVQVRCPHRITSTVEGTDESLCNVLLRVRDLSDHLKKEHANTWRKADKGITFSCPFHRQAGKKQCQEIGKKKRTKATDEKGNNLVRHLRSNHLALGSEKIVVHLTVDEVKHPISVDMPLGGRTDLTNRSYGHAVLSVIQDLQRQGKVALPGLEVHAKWTSKSGKSMKEVASESRSTPRKVTATTSKATKVSATTNKAKKTSTLRSKAKVAASAPHATTKKASAT
ncbi:hypothetical protein BKA70DRAFT_1505333 [Coprinopsis sp. MPI-PUGE-AT-0042]|nr:hypothetical protein BKA70DRAFT_1505333 [Coprinopsis sp. MPI-PUGE-AT-0042]